jgi:hypothetical protein
VADALLTSPAGATSQALPSPFTVTARYTAASLGLDHPDALAIGPDGNPYVTDASQRVTVLSPPPGGGAAALGQARIRTRRVQVHRPPTRQTRSMPWGRSRSGPMAQPTGPTLVYDHAHRLIAKWPGTTYSLLASPVFGPQGEVFALATDRSILRLHLTSPGA